MTVNGIGVKVIMNVLDGLKTVLESIYRSTHLPIVCTEYIVPESSIRRNGDSANLAFRVIPRIYLDWRNSGYICTVQYTQYRTLERVLCTVHIVHTWLVATTCCTYIGRYRVF